jgi:hypothetical protein
MNQNQLLMNLSSASRAASAVSIAALVVACGGGGSDAGAPSTSQLTGTQGNAAAYRGVWRTECGAVLDGTELRGIKFVFDITNSEGNTATGRLTTMRYIDTTACTNASPLTTTDDDLTLTIDPTAVGVIGDFAGTADKVTMSASGAVPSTSYFGFVPNLIAFYISNSNTFTGGRLRYTKAAP